MLEIRYFPDPILRRVAEPVERIDEELRRLAEEMIETMYAAKGVGLAAPQVGISKRMIVVDTTPEGRSPQVFLNPVAHRLGRQKETTEEGCLSIPDIRAKVTRPSKILLEAFNLQGAAIRLEAEGLLACALQHEIDHLDGILFIDRISIAKKFSLRNELHRREEEYARLHPMMQAS